MYFFTSFCWICYFIGIIVCRGRPVKKHNVDLNMVSYEGWQVWRVALRNRAAKRLVEQLIDSHDVEIWRLNRKAADVMIMPYHLEEMLRIFTKFHLNFTVLIPNVQNKIVETIAEETPSMWSGGHTRLGHRLSFKSYPTLRVLEEYYNYLGSNYDSICKIKTMGRSFQKRPIKMVTLSNGDPNNKVIFITAGHHAREWVGVSAALYIINYYIVNYKTLDPSLKNKDWHIIPLVNPDGFEYTQMKDRLWRKNMRNVNDKCIGVDLNRNYDMNWNNLHVNTGSPCSITYPGQAPFSEPETTTVSKALKTLSLKPMAYFDFHSYGQLILHPWSVDTSKPHINEKKLKDTAVGIGKAIYNATRMRYQAGTARELMYAASGAAIDWFYSMGVPLPYAIEAQDSGYHGFLLPNHMIEDACKDLLAGVKYVSEVLDGKFGNKGYWLM